MIDPWNASVCFTPLDVRHRIHPTVGRLIILPTSQVETALDPAPEPLDHATYARPPQTNSFAEAVAVVPEGEADPLRGAMLTAVRLVTLDGLDARTVFATFAAHVEGWAAALPDGRFRHHHRLAVR